MVSTLFHSLIRSAPMRPVRNLLRPLASRWNRPVPVRLKCGLVCYVDLRTSLGRGLLVKGEFDPVLGGFLDRELSPGGVFLDVGSNIGCFSLAAAARVGPTGQVHAFEIVDECLRCLRMSKEAGKLDHLTIHRMAVGEHEGSVGVHREPEIYQSWVNDSGTGIPMGPLDSLLPELAGRNVQVIKIDVEGMELRVLRGARELLMKHRPVVVAEILGELLGRFGATPDDVAGYMRELGYTVSGLDGTFDNNWVFRPRERSGL